MAFVKSIFNAVKKTSGPPRDPVIASWYGGSETESGESISPDTVTKISAVLACVRVLSETIAGLPLFVYTFTKGGGKSRDFNHPLSSLLHGSPNRWQTSFEFKELMMWMILLRGNAYAEIVSTGRKGISELIPRHPDAITPFFAEDGEIAYQYQPQNKPARFILRDEMHHWRSFSKDGLVGESVISHARESLGISMAADKYGARYFKNDATPTGIIKYPGHFKDSAMVERLKKGWAESQGGKNRHKPAVLEDGMDFMQLNITNKDSQFLELKQFQVTDIARMFLVQPHKIMDLSRATFSNIEQQGIDFVTSSLQSWVTRIEQATERDLLSGNEKKKNFIRFNMSALLRGDSAARGAFYNTLFNIGVLSQNDIRRLEDRNPIKGGDTYYVPLNMIPAEQAADQSGKKADQLIESAALRMVRQEAGAVAKSKEKMGAAEFKTWLNEFYEKHSEKVASALVVDIQSVKEYFNGQIDIVSELGVNEECRLKELKILGASDAVRE